MVNLKQGSKNDYKYDISRVFVFLATVLISVPLMLQGCKEKTDIESLKPVIPLVEHGAEVSEDMIEAYPSLYLKGEYIDKTDDNESEKNDTLFGGEGLEGVQLSEEQLDKMSAYFNLKDVNPHLQQVYLIPDDYDETAKEEYTPVKCVGGTYDSNGLYSIFYKKEGSKTLWNVVMRRDKEGEDSYRFHSNIILEFDERE
ncbi:MAG: hypothetical protein K6E98_00935 [Lachnospiraceae bacterium]|nr:hypothetical protein [Lachnospiraceae bacterium]